MTEEKEKKVSKGGEVYNLASRVMEQGYDATIDGRRFVIDFVKNFKGERQTEFASVCSLQSTPKGQAWTPILPQIFYFTDLTDLQLWNLAKARVITLNKEQAKAFREKFYKPTVLEDA